MKFSCEKNLLQNACATASRAAAAKSPIPTLEGLLLQASSRLKITGYDLKEGIYTSIEADIAEGGSIVVNAKLFNEIIRRMPDGIIQFESDSNLNINLRCGKSVYNFIGISPDDYPEMPDVDRMNEISVPQNILSSMISQTIFAVSTSDARPIYTGTLFEIEDETLTLVSIDGFRLAKRTEKIENGKLENCSFVVPGASLSDIEKICGENDEKASICVGSKHISFEIGDTVVVTRRLEGEFLNYRKSIPENFRYNIVMERSDLLQAIDRVALIINEKNGSPVKMKFNNGYVDFSTVTGIGKADDECSCEGNGDGLQIGFNDKYITEALKAANTDKLSICLNTASAPCVIKAADGSDHFTFMILPVRLRQGA